MAVFEKVQEIIVEELGKEPSEVTLESTFDDLEADSLDLFQVISEIDQFKFLFLVQLLLQVLFSR